MLDEFLTAHRIEILARARAKIETRAAPRPTHDELVIGIPLFLDQLVAALRRFSSDTDAIGVSATTHGRELLDTGFTVAQVVHDYGDICQAVTELAVELQAPITADEFHTLNRCLDDATAAAVTEYQRVREDARSTEETERLGVLAHGLRNRLGAATLAYAAIKSGVVGVGGSTGAVLDRSLQGLRELIDGALAQVRIESGLQQQQRIVVADLVTEVGIDASLEANEYAIGLTVAPVDHAVVVYADHAILAASLNNLLQNAFKFSRPNGHVTFTTTASAERVLFHVEDECGGLPRGMADELFRPFVQRSTNRSGLGLGLSICQRGAAASGGTVRVKNLPGKGCIFTIELPRAA